MQDVSVAVDAGKLEEGPHTPGTIKFIGNQASWTRDRERQREKEKNIRRRKSANDCPRTIKLTRN